MKGSDDIASQVISISIQIMMEVRVVFLFVHILSIARVLTSAPTYMTIQELGPNLWEENLER